MTIGCRGAGRSWALAWAVALAALAGSPLLWAGDKPEKKQKPRQVHPTGEEDAKAPTLEELQAEAALEQMTSRSSEGLVAVEHGNGMVSVDLEGRFMSVMVATPGRSGAARTTCVQGQDGLAKARKATPGAPAPAATPAKPEPKVAPVLEEK